MKALIVDDTIVYRSQLKDILSQISPIRDIETAAHGRIALQKMQHNPSDLIITDLEMPEMDGLEMVKELRRQGSKAHIIMFSGSTRSVMELTFEALKAGANDFIAKPDGKTQSLEDSSKKLKDSLVPIILGIQKLKDTTANGPIETTLPPKKTDPKDWKKIKLTQFHPRLIVIASSTGGPMALEKIFFQYKNIHSPPILIAQHMPPKFTALFAERLSKISHVIVKEAENGEKIKKGVVYIAPGDFHMEMAVASEGGGFQIRLHQGPKRNFVRPAADYLFESAAQLVGSQTLGIVLTGMGEDGCQGAIAIKDNLGGMFIQDEASCVVWGMAGATHRAQAFDEMGNLDQCRSLLDLYMI
jgi:two-component system chemotaxis response regulator CheB